MQWGAPCKSHRSVDFSSRRSMFMSNLSLLGLFAHPDDEQLMSGTFARAASEGIRTGLLCATRGEMGEIAEADPVLATPDTLGGVRGGELRAGDTGTGT